MKREVTTKEGYKIIGEEVAERPLKGSFEIRNNSKTTEGKPGALYPLL